MFYERLKLLCDNKGIKLTNLIQELGMSSGNMNKWKKGVVPKGSTLSKLADYFNVSVDYLIGKTEEQTNIHYVNNINDINDSNFIQGNIIKGDTSISVPSSTNKSTQLSKEETEILNIYRSLEARDRTKFMNFVFEMQDETEKI